MSWLEPKKRELHLAPARSAAASAPAARHCGHGLEPRGAHAAPDRPGFPARELRGPLGVLRIRCRDAQPVGTPP